MHPLPAPSAAGDVNLLQHFAMQSGRSRLRKGRVDGVARRQLASTLTSTCHALRRTRQAKVTTHVIALCILEIGDDATGVVRDEGCIRLWTPIAPATPVTIPALPQRRECIDATVCSDLEVWNCVTASIAHARIQSPATVIFLRPREVGMHGTVARVAHSCAHRRASSEASKKNAQTDCVPKARVHDGSNKSGSSRDGVMVSIRCCCLMSSERTRIAVETQRRSIQRTAVTGAVKM